MLVYVIRHGTTDWNEAKRLQGNSNTSLNEKGRDLAHLTARGMKDLHLDVIYSSPLDRAYETAQILRGDRDIPIIKDERLKEICFGVNEGVVPEDRTPGCIKFFEAPAEYVPAEGAESIESLRDRTADFINSVLVPMSIEKPDASVLISGHGAMNKGLMLTFMHREIKDFWAGAWQKNCCVTIIEVNGSDFKLVEDGKYYY